MMRDPVKVLLGNLSISNLLCAVFVQLISAILGGYAISINDYQVQTNKIVCAKSNCVQKGGIQSAIDFCRTTHYHYW